jgi:predicted neuraminidase
VKRLRVASAIVALALLTMPQVAPAAATLSRLRGVPEIKSWFNAYKGRPRLILLLSPT